MSDIEIDYACYVAAYELRRADELPEKDRRFIHDPPNVRHLVQVSRAKLIRPKRKTMDMVVGLLLKTQVPKLHGGTIADLNADELAALERNVLAISRQIGMLLAGQFSSGEIKTDLGYLHHESISDWFQLAQWIQRMFTRQTEKVEVRDVGRLSLLLLHKPDGTASMHIRPDSTKAALVYHAAQMIAGGTTFHACENCGTPFLGGGARRGREKKRGDARFCTNECRYSYHNEMRRKTRKSKS